MQDVSDKLLGQFVACLEQRLSAEPGGAASRPRRPSRRASRPPRRPLTPAVPPEPARGRTSGTAPSAAAAPPQQDDALDLGAAVLPVLAKTYWKPVVGAVVVAGVVIWLVSRR